VCDQNGILGLFRFDWGPVLTVPSEFAWKWRSLFNPQTTPDEFENAIGHFGYVVEDNSGREISLLTPISWCQLPFQNVLRLLRSEDSFWKAPFPSGISVHGRSNCRYKAPFSSGNNVDGRSNCRYKAPFSSGNNVDGRANCRYKAVFSNSSSLKSVYFCGQ